ncbi:MAG: hypothetical protein H0X64_03925, partial [Gemmatimonadaceae bacterium]|nr:hypothetical protein [Gemmatimonadaceae bacterium]
MKRTRPGVALLEALVALTILGVLGSALAALAMESSSAAAHAAAAEVAVQRASRFLEVVAVWPRADLDRRLGTRRQGEWQLTVSR